MTPSSAAGSSRHLRAPSSRPRPRPGARCGSRAVQSRAGRPRRRGARAERPRGRPCHRAPRVARMRIHAPGIANSANHPSPFGRCRCEWCASSWARTTFCSSSEKGSRSIVSQKTTRRDGPRPYAYALACSVSWLTSSTRIGMSPTPSSGSYSARRREQRLVAQRIGREVEVRRDEREERRDGDEHRRAGEPPAVAEPARETHHDEEREADREELRGEHRPVLDQPVEVAQLALSFRRSHQ